MLNTIIKNLIGSLTHKSRLSCKLKQQYAHEIFDLKQKRNILFINSCSIGKHHIGKIETVERPQFTVEAWMENMKVWRIYQNKADRHKSRAS